MNQLKGRKEEIHKEKEKKGRKKERKKGNKTETHEEYCSEKEEKEGR